MSGRGRFITFEGGEGTGKSTQAALLAAALRDLGLPVRLTREPGGTPGAEAIRTLIKGRAVDAWSAKAEALLHYAARQDHLERTILPALSTGEWVVCDRFADSTFAYQSAGQGLDAEWLQRLQALVVGEHAPDITLILDLDPEVARARLTGRGLAADRYEGMSDAFHRRVRQAFLSLAAAAPDRCLVFDAAASAEVVQARLFACVASRFGLTPGLDDR